MERPTFESEDYEQGEGFSPRKTLAKNKGKAIILVAVVSMLVMVVMMAAMMATPTGAIAALGEDIIGFLGITKEQVNEVEEAMGDDLEAFRKEYEDDFRAALDCSNFPPAERDPGVNCIEGLLAGADNWSPIPADMAWMVPVWQKAANRYGVPWEVLAAINGARTNFGRKNCPGAYGSGFYRITSPAWSNYGLEAGSATLSQAGSCYDAKEPAKVDAEYGKALKTLSEERQAGRNDNANIYDPVDSTFTTGFMLAKGGAFKNGPDWDYSGSPSNNCTVADYDGPIVYAPEPPSDDGGGFGATNKKLELPRWAIELSKKYRKKWDPSTSYQGVIPDKELLALLQVAWQAMGANPNEAKHNAKLNLAQIHGESGGRPYAIQTVVDVNSGGNEAGGLFQFIPSTFETWAIGGFPDRFSALDNILAAVNAQANSDYVAAASGSFPGGILDGQHGGWGPSGGSNPYKGKGSFSVTNDDGTSASDPIKPHPYKGKEQTDKLSRAISSQAGGASPCYVAVVNDWYKLIKKYPPAGVGIGGRADLTKVIRLTSPRALKELPGFCGYAGTKIDARVWTNMVWACREYGLFVTGAAESGHATHGDGTAADIVPAKAVNHDSWVNSTEKFARDLGWSPDCGPVGTSTEYGGTCKLVGSIHFIGYNGFPSHGDDRYPNSHLHVSWDSPTFGTATCCVVPPWVEIFQVGSTGGGDGGGGSAYLKGGEVKGSILRTLPPVLRQYNHSYKPIPAPDWSGYQMPKSHIAALAEWAGNVQGINVPGETMEQVTRGESIGRPGSCGDDDGNGTIDGYGLWAITRPYAEDMRTPKNSPTFKELGEYKGMFNPIANALMMARFYESRGNSTAAWYGDRFVTDHNAHYDGPILKRN